MRYEYAARETVEALGLQFEPADERQIDQLRDSLQPAADVIGGEVSEIVPPKDGFLVKSLTDSQRAHLNLVLTLSYASTNLGQQGQLRGVEIVENHEHVVDFRKYLQENGEGALATFGTMPIHEACGSVWAKKQRVMWIRKSTAAKLVSVCQGLNALNLQAVLLDMWRHEDVQRGLFYRRVTETAREYDVGPGGRKDKLWDWRQVKAASQSFTASIADLAGHMSASAVDLQLAHALSGGPTARVAGKRAKRPRDGRKLEILPTGNTYPEGGAVSSLDFPYLTQEEWETRVIFMEVMRLAGFRLLRTENWHASHGDRGLGLDGSVHMKTAKHGPIRSFDPATGEVIPFEPEDAKHYFLDDREIERHVLRSRERHGRHHRYTAVELAEMLHQSHAGRREESVRMQEALAKYASPEQK